MNLVRLVLCAGLLMVGSVSFATLQVDDPAEKATDEAVADNKTDATAQGPCPICEGRKVPPGTVARSAPIQQRTQISNLMNEGGKMPEGKGKSKATN